MIKDEPYFNRIGDYFLQHIYATAKGRVRLAVLQRDLLPLLNGGSLRILDVGGGAGQMAVWCALLGHEVVVVDKSAQLLHSGKETAKQFGVADKVHFVEGDALDLRPVLGEARFDGVCCHAVLEWMAEGERLLAACAERMGANAFFSLMFYNRDALWFAQHVFGNFDYIDRDLTPYRKTAKLTPDFPRSPETVAAWLETLDLRRLRRSPVRCFYDYMKSHDRERHSVEALVARELRLAEDERYLPVARYVHELRVK